MLLLNPLFLLVLVARSFENPLDHFWVMSAAMQQPKRPLKARNRS